VKSEPVVLPCHFDIILLQLNFKTDDDLVVKQHLERIRGLISEEVQNRINKDGLDHVGCGNDYVVTVSLDSMVKCLRIGAVEGTFSSHWPCGLMDYLSSSIKDLSDDILVDELLQSYSPRDSDANGGRYTILVTGERNGDKHSHRTVIGKHRHAWVHGVFKDSVVPLIGEVVVKYFIGGGIVVSGRGQGFGTTNEKGEAMPLAADGTATLSFSLLNAEPADWIHDW
jgi:phosphatidylinositol glycan class S